MRIKIRVFEFFEYILAVMPEKLQTPIEYLKGVGPARAEVLQKELGIFTFQNLLEHFPYRYIDKSTFHKASEVTEHLDYVQIKGKLSRFFTIGGGRKSRLTAKIQDDTGSIELVWFQGQKWVQQSLKPGVEYVAYGKPNRYGRNISIAHPDVKPVAQYQKEQTGLEPLYSSTDPLKKKGLDSRGILKIMRNLINQIGIEDIIEILPFDLLDEMRLMSRFKAFKNIHLPPDTSSMKKAVFRLKFEELLLVQMKLARMKVNRNIQYKGFHFEKIDNWFHRFYEERLPFELTRAQKRVLKEIRKDTLSGKQMNRLLQGDVGSGKTIVSLLCMLMAKDNGFQSALMAPTEILAQQHFEGISELLKNFGVNVAILTGSVKGATRKQVFTALKEGAIDILIGTHALLEDKVVFKNIGLAVIDEQHRFGVAQRAKLWKKNINPPHILVMTATPIPRTLAMTFYGDLDTSVIDELPPGRKPIRTTHRRDNSRMEVFGFIKKEIDKGRQIYIVYPLIEESATLDYKHLMDGYESISRAFPLPDYKVSIVHGKMKPADKEHEMQRFVKGETQIMVATTVIEVGVNVPNASVMIIESAERFGLSQLHQLRGRVGRGADQSYCILMTGMKLSADARERMKIMCETNDGFRIAEADLRLRGPGDLMGTQQSGLLSLKLSNLKDDREILTIARNKAYEIIKADPFLDKEEHRFLKTHLNSMEKMKIGWSRIS